MLVRLIPKTRYASSNTALQRTHGAAVSVVMRRGMSKRRRRERGPRRGARMMATKRQTEGAMQKASTYPDGRCANPSVLRGDHPGICGSLRNGFEHAAPMTIIKQLASVCELMVCYIRQRGKYRPDAINVCDAIQCTESEHHWDAQT